MTQEHREAIAREARRAMQTEWLEGKRWDEFRVMNRTERAYEAADAILALTSTPALDPATLEAAAGVADYAEHEGGLAGVSARGMARAIAVNIRALSSNQGGVK